MKSFVRKISAHQIDDSMYCSEYTRDWAAVEYDVLGVILNKVESLYDHLQFSVVCKSWYFIALRYKHQRPLITSKIPQLPMLIVPSKDGIEKQHCLYDLIKNQIRPVDFKFRFNKRCCGSSFGWLIMLEETLDVTLFNPFSGSVIRLPPITLRNVNDGPDVYSSACIVKAIVTKDPSLYPNDYMVVAIYSSLKNLCLMKANDKIWIYHRHCPGDNISIGDVNVCNDALYAFGNNMKLWKIEVDNSSSSIALKMVTALDYLGDICQVYIAESSKREVLLVKRILCTKMSPSKTIEFSVYKLSDECDQDEIQKAIEVERLDGDAMFIGDNQSICVSTKIFLKCLPNRIYFTYGYHQFNILGLNRPEDAGIFNLEDKSFGKHYTTDRAHRNLPHPIWIVPTI